MGIPGLFGSHIRHIGRTKKFSNIVKKSAFIESMKNPGYYYNIYETNVSTFSIDFNGLLHFIANKTYNYNKELTDKELVHGRQPVKALPKKKSDELKKEFKNSLWENVLLLFEITKPKDAFIIAVDGIAPYGKIIQQRRRRFSHDSYFNAIFDSNSITPGTDFMFEIDEFIQSKLNELKDKFDGKIIYSSHLVPGEGEHKIFEYLRDKSIAPNKSRESNIIFGLDADLIMLSILSPCNNMILLRETDKIESRDVLDKHIYADILFIEELKSYLRFRKVPYKDYVLMIMLLGNDFLPHSPSLKKIGKSIDQLMNYHYQGKYKLVDEDNNIKWRDFRKLLINLTEIEFDTISSSGDTINPSRLISASFEYNPKLRKSFFNEETFRTLWYNRNFRVPSKGADLGITDMLSKYSNIEVEFEVFEEDIEKMAEQYLRVLNWNFLYYTEGYKSVNSSVGYEHDFAPLFIDIVNSLTEFIISKKIEYENIRNEKDNSYMILHQLISVLPKSSIKLIPKPYRFLMDTESPIIDLFPIQWDEITEGSDKKHNFLQRIPIPNRERIIQAVSEISFDAKEISKWIESKDIIIQSKKKK